MQRLIRHLESPSDDPSRFPTIQCANCGASVSPDVDVYETEVGVDSHPSGSFVRWTCERCGHTRMSAISADVTREELEELEREAEKDWRQGDDE